MWSNEAITACAVGIACALILIAAAGVIRWLMTRKLRSCAFGNTVISLGSCSRHDLRPELNKAGVPIPLGKGGYGEVGTSWPYLNQATWQQRLLRCPSSHECTPCRCSYLVRLSKYAQCKT